MENQLGKNQFQYARDQGKQLYSTSASKSKNNQSLINRQLGRAVGSSHKQHLKENWAQEWVEKARKLTFDDIKIERLSAVDINKQANVKTHIRVSSNSKYVSKDSGQKNTQKKIARNIDFNDLSSISISDAAQKRKSGVIFF